MMLQQHVADKLVWHRLNVRLGDLIGWEQNPRQSSKEQVRRIIDSEKVFGQALPFLVNPADKNGKFLLLDGHQRLAAWQSEYGPNFMVEVAVASRPLTDDEHRRLVINLHATAVGQWDWDALSSWDSDTLGSWGMDEKLVAVWKNDLTNLRHMTSLPKDLGENDTSNLDGALGEHPVSVGDVFHIGDHRLACGDSKDPDLVKMLFDVGPSAALVFTDPPWNVDYTGGMKKRDELEDDDIPDDAWIPAISKSLQIAPTYSDAAMYLVYGMMNTLQTYQAVTTADWRIIQNLVWVKQNAVFGRRNSKHYKYQHEGIIYATRDTKKQPRFFGDNNEVSVWNHDRMSKNLHHPTEKPVELYEHGIINSSQMDEVVYDPFSGSGTLLIACQNRARRGYAIEKDPRYVAITLQRMSSLFPQLTIEKVASATGQGN